MRDIIKFCFLFLCDNNTRFLLMSQTILYQSVFVGKDEYANLDENETVAH